MKRLTLGSVALALVVAASGCGNATQGRGATPRPNPRRMDLAALFVFQPGKRATRLIDCVRKAVTRQSVQVRGPHRANGGHKPRVDAYFFIALDGGTGRSVHDLVEADLRACDPRWRDLAFLSSGRGGGGTAFGSN